MYRLPLLLEDMIAEKHRMTITEQLKTYVEQSIPDNEDSSDDEDDDQEGREPKQRMNLYIDSWKQSLVQDQDANSPPILLFLLEKFMQRLGFIGSKKQPKESSDSIDHFSVNYSPYDLLFVIVYLYFGLCKNRVISLPQLRVEKLGKKPNAQVEIQRLTRLREIATTKSVSTDTIRSVWKYVEPMLLEQVHGFQKNSFEVVRLSTADKIYSSLLRHVKNTLGIKTPW